MLQCLSWKFLIVWWLPSSSPGITVKEHILSLYPFAEISILQGSGSGKTRSRSSHIFSNTPSALITLGSQHYKLAPQV
ncbi:hypothetical protein E2C01_046294 [Portunus trituberculatus]|uniref:Secreted protein n=1 Tax=Portunus trituberculatus TaxID=210409 RepID=A0A5B7G4U5_PORTR|nr:hypothetical protein [Portunus trituberculatus]